jgi:hypothetical protein
MQIYEQLLFSPTQSYHHREYGFSNYPEAPALPPSPSDSQTSLLTFELSRGANTASSSSPPIFVAIFVDISELSSCFWTSAEAWDEPAGTPARTLAFRYTGQR